MHQVIKIIVYSDSEAEALSKAKGILNDNLVGEEGQSFDYGTFFDEDDAVMSGKARFGTLPAVVLADSKEGKKLIEDGMKSTKDGFMKNLQKVKEAIKEYTDEELFEEELLDTKKKILVELNGEQKRPHEIGFFKHYCDSLSCYKNSNIYLYDNDGEAIDKTSHLKNVLNKWAGNDWAKKDNLKVYVVPVDVHY